MDHEMVAEAVRVSGTFGGHVLPGAMFIGWALFWYAAAMRSGAASGPALEPGATMPVIKVTLPLVGVWVEIPGTGWYPMDVMMNWQHITMYAVFGLAGVVDLLALAGRVPAQSTRVAYAAAHLNAGFLFLGHVSHGGVEGVAHALLAALFAAAAGAALLEIARPSAATAWTRRATLLAVGLWFVVVGLILYRSGWDPTDPVRVGWTFTAFSWTAVAVGALTVTASLLARRARVPSGSGAAPAAAGALSGRGLARRQD
ncbi:MAG TPA: DUF716 domain-containing protein [Longimicrobiales bacterium]|nr:DUF716 domain-containing protein [Longimicrobiales bacterium]